MVVVKNEEDLVEVLNFANENNLKVHILGLGTNTVFGENLEKFLIIKIEIKGIELEESKETDKIILNIGAGESWDDVVKFAVENNLWGIENLSYIPGTVGAAPVQNIGAYGSEIKNTLVSVKAYDVKLCTFVTMTNKECDFSYRDSIFKREKNRYIIVQIILLLNIVPNPTLSYKPLDSLLGKENLKIEEIRNLVIKIRKQKLPDYNLYPNSGSFFKNPIVTKETGEQLKLEYPDISLFESNDLFKVSAAWLIEHVAKMKGVREGNIGTWPNQPLVLVNYGEDTNIDELRNFSKKIKDVVKEKSGIMLEEEINIIA